MATRPALGFSSVPGWSRPLGSGRAMLGSEPALSLADRRGGLSFREAEWLELEEAPGLGGAARQGLPPPRSDSLRHRDSLPAASSRPDSDTVRGGETETEKQMSP